MINKAKKWLIYSLISSLILSRAMPVFAEEVVTDEGAAQLTTDTEPTSLGDPEEYAEEGAEEGAEESSVEPELPENNGVIVTKKSSEEPILRNGNTPSVTDPSYDARNYGLVTPIKDQGNDGTCYIFSGVALAETSLLKDFPEDFSPTTLNIDEGTILDNLYKSNPDPLGLIGYDHAVGDKTTGAQVAVLFPEFASNSCPVQKGGAAYYDTVATLKEALSINVKDLEIEDIKRLLLKYGAVSTSIILSEARSRNGASKWYYPLEKYNSLPPYFHAVSIIGWNDLIPASEFENEYNEVPSCDGGWLIKNSWGTNCGEDGFFWLSYEDGAFKDNGGVTHSIEVMSFERANEWNVYQYDGGNNATGTGVEYAANIFPAKANPGGTESLSRVGAFIGTGEYTIRVYKYTDETKAPWAQDTLLGSTNLSVSDYYGYHTAYLETPITLSYGEKFSVCINKTDGTSFRIGYDSYNERNAVSVGAGEGYVKDSRTDAEFIDARYHDTTFGGRGANLRIKAFTLNNNDGEYATKTIASVTVSGNDHTYTGSEIKPEVIVKDTNGNTINKRLYKVEYSNNINAGIATVSVSSKSRYVEGSAETTFTIAPKDLSSATVTAAQPTYVYKGSAYTPTATVKLSNITLISDTDYTLSYSNNVNAGNATLTVTGKGNYTGSTSKQFTITPVDYRDVSITYPLSMEYTGQPIHPPVTLSYNGMYLVSDTDYDLIYAENIDYGSGSFRITFKGNYTGTVTKFFDITQRDGRKCTVSYNRDNEYTGGSIAPAVTVSYNGEALTEGRDYYIDYSNNVQITDVAKVTISFRNLYYGTIDRYFSITPRGSDDVIIGTVEDDTERIYNGAQHTPSSPPAVWRRTLAKGTDYDISYKDNINAGTGFIVYTFKGNLKGERLIPFTIYPESLDNTTVGEIPSQTHTGEEITPDVSITWNGTVLENDKDYTVFYENNINAGTATATITGINNFSGTIKKAFIIKASSNGSGNITPTPVNPPVPRPDPGNDNPSDNPTEEEPGSTEEETKPVIRRQIQANGNGLSVTLTINPIVPYTPNKKDLVKSLDLTLSENKGISVKSVKAGKPKNGKVSVTIKLKGSGKEEKQAVKEMNKGLKGIEIIVDKVDISKATVDISLNSKGTKVKKVTVNGVKLKKSDYSTIIENGKVTVTGQGNYTGTTILAV